MLYPVPVTDAAPDSWLLPVLVIVMACVEEKPVFTSPKLTEVGLAEIMGGLMALPETDTVAPPPPEKVIVAEWLPGAVGL